MTALKVVVLEPTFPVATEVTKEDVWGRWSKDHKQIHRGMVVARSDERCPVFKDVVPYKSATVVCDASIREEVAYWLEYVQGSDCISQVRELPEKRVAFRADYMAW